MAGALIITAEIGERDFSSIDQLRRENYPADRNRLPAHLTLFYALPPSAEREARQTLARISSDPPPRASLEGFMDLGGGVAFRVVSEDLDRIRDELADRFCGLLSAQDIGGWRPHITIQNKVRPRVARELKACLEAGFRPRPLQIKGLGLYRYLDGPWEKVASYSFHGS